MIRFYEKYNYNIKCDLPQRVFWRWLVNLRDCEALCITSFYPETQLTGELTCSAFSTTKMHDKMSALCNPFLEDPNSRFYYLSNLESEKPRQLPFQPNPAQPNQPI